jgi:hypothetical protein
MRKVFSVAMMAAALCLVGMTRDASATATITLIWGACGGGAGGCVGVGSSTLTVAAGGGQTLRLDIFMTHNESVTGLGTSEDGDPPGIVAHSFSVNFDTDLGNELNFTAGMAPVEWAGSDVNPGPLNTIYGPNIAGVDSTLDSTGANAGRINAFESLGFQPLPPTGLAYSVGTFSATAPASYRVGQAFFTVNAGAAFTDGADVFAGSFNGVNGNLDNTSDNAGPPGNDVTMNFGTASVNGIVIPEPGTVSLLGLGLVGLVVAGRRARRS